MIQQSPQEAARSKLANDLSISRIHNFTNYDDAMSFIEKLDEDGFFIESFTMNDFMMTASLRRDCARVKVVSFGGAN